MTIARIIIEDAFDDMEIKPGEVALKDSEIAIGIRRLNRLMAKFAAEGLNVGYSDVASPEDETNIPQYFEDLAITTLAIRLSQGFGKDPRPGLMMAYETSLMTVELRLVDIPRPLFPNILPIGAGNYDSDNTRFFTDGEFAELTDDADVQLQDGEGMDLATNQDLP